MFVEKLTREQVEEFVRHYLVETDFHPELLNQNCQIKLSATYGKQSAVEIFYCSKAFNGHMSIFLTDDEVMPKPNRNLEENWIKYLHSVFGEEYMDWYLQEKAKLFQEKEE